MLLSSSQAASPSKPGVQGFQAKIPVWCRFLCGRALTAREMEEDGAGAGDEDGGEDQEDEDDDDYFEPGAMGSRKPRMRDGVCVISPTNCHP